MAFEPPIVHAVLRAHHIVDEMLDEHVLLWRLPDGGVVLDLRGQSPEQIALKRSDVLIVAWTIRGECLPTTLVLLRNGHRRTLASGTATLAAPGLFGPSLARDLASVVESVGCEIRREIG